jgi:Protein of unknown function (DUF3638).
VTALISMTSEEGNNMELEARTGFGKSQVLIPLWLFLKSRSEETITMMVVPASLVSDQERHLHRLLGKTLSKGIHKITFSREKASDLAASKKTTLRSFRCHEKQTDHSYKYRVSSRHDLARSERCTFQRV